MNFYKWIGTPSWVDHANLNKRFFILNNDGGFITYRYMDSKFRFYRGTEDFFKHSKVLTKYKKMLYAN